MTSTTTLHILNEQPRSFLHIYKIFCIKSDLRVQWGMFNCNPFPVAVLAMQLAMVEGPDRLPADMGTQEVLCRKLCVLEADLTEVTNLIFVWSSLLEILNNSIFNSNEFYIT